MKGKRQKRLPDVGEAFKYIEKTKGQGQLLNTAF